jgi:hypothetical protein
LAANYRRAAGSQERADLELMGQIGARLAGRALIDLVYTGVLGFHKVDFQNGGLAMKYGYARVSSKAQDYTAQVDGLKAAACEKIYSEKQSGKSRNGRPEFAKLMKALLPGDTVVVTKLDRLARSSRDLQTSCTSWTPFPAASYRSGRAGATPRPRPAG